MKATNGRGLQPAMDFLFENEGKPIPDPTTLTSTSAATSAVGGPSSGNTDVDDEDIEALKAVYGHKGDIDAQAAAASAAADVEAKVGEVLTCTHSRACSC